MENRKVLHLFKAAPKPEQEEAPVDALGDEIVKKTLEQLAICPHKDKYPRGSVPTHTVKVDMAVGAYQFHDLLSSHYDPVTEKYLAENYDDINDNFELGFLNL